MPDDVLIGNRRFYFNRLVPSENNVGPKTPGLDNLSVVKTQMSIVDTSESQDTKQCLR